MAAHGAVTGRWHRTAGASYRLLSDVDGRIAHACLALPTYQSETVPRLLECVGGVVRALGPDVRCSILHHAGDEHLLEGLATRQQLDLIPWSGPRTIRIGAGGYQVENGVLRLGSLPWSDFTPWVQDCFLVALRSGTPQLLASPHVSRPGGGADEDVAGTVAGHLGWASEMLAVPFEAANVLVDQRHVVLGRAVGRELPSRTAAATLRRLFAPDPSGPSVLRMPPRSAQPRGHQDMYLALAGAHPASGRPMALVGSRRLAARILGRRHAPDAADAGLERVSRAMEARGYDVTRLPCTTVRLSPTWKHSEITYTNALVEVWPLPGPGGLARRVTIARFGTDGGPEAAALDAAATEIWRALGFAVRFAEGPFTWLGIFEGSVRCLTKVLARR